MKDLVFITGNQNKADYLAKWLKIPLQHQKIDLDEIQSLDLREVVANKARRAYDIVQKPVLVEDVSLSFDAFDRLPGTFIKWFLTEIGSEELCKMLDHLPSRKAKASIYFCYYDGQDMQFFYGQMRGEIAEKPRGKNGFGWDEIFIKDGMDKTRAELTGDEQERTSMRHAVHAELREFLTNLSK